MRRRKLANAIDDPGRRQFLSNAARVAFGVTAVPWLNSLGLGAVEPGDVPYVKPKATRVINLFMSGGMCHFDSFDPKPALTQKGATKPIGTSADSQFSELIPNLAGLADKMTVIRSMTSDQGAHEQGKYFMRTGYKQVGTSKHPVIGGWADLLHGKRNHTLPSSVIIGGGSTHPGGGFLPSRHAPLEIGSASDGLPHCQAPGGVGSQRQQLRYKLLNELEKTQADRIKADASRTAYRQLFDEAIELMNSRDLAAFNIREESGSAHEEYGDSRFGLGCLLARRLIQNDVRYVEVTKGGWDSHADHTTESELNFPEFDRVASTLIKDLHRRGLLDSTIVMITTEFGRTPDWNTNEGRDHHPSCFTSVLAGGPFKRGYIHGESDPIANKPAKNSVTIPDLHTTVSHALGLPIDHVVYSPAGRPFTAGGKGNVLQELFS